MAFSPPGGAHGLSASSGGGRGRGRGSRGLGSGDGPPPLLDPGRERDTRRILRLFAPYKARLSVVMGLILVSSALNGVSPFLLRAIIGVAFVHHDTTLLTELVLGMIAIAIATSALADLG